MKKSGFHITAGRTASVQAGLLSMLAALVALFFCICLPSSALCGEAFVFDNWRVESRQDGITTYSCAFGKSGYRCYKATGVIDASMEQIGAVLRDVPEYPRWMDYLSHAEIVRKYSPNNMDVYFVIDFPWPVSDRDAVVRADVYIDDKIGRTVTTTTAIEDPAFSPGGDFVRLPTIFEQYVLTFLEPSRSLMTFLVYIEAGGNVPVWAVNDELSRIPARVLENLRVMVKEEKYRHADPFDEANADITRGVARAVMGRYIKDKGLVSFAVSNETLVRRILDGCCSDAGRKYALSAVLREYVKSPDYLRRIERSPHKGLLAKIAQQGVADRVMEDGSVVELLLKSGRLDGPVIDQMASRVSALCY